MPRYNPHRAYRTTPKRKYMAHTGHRCLDYPCCGHEDGYCPAPKAETPSEPPPAADNGIPVLTENSDKDGYELKFPGKPSEAVLALFRETKTLSVECRWHWHFKAKFWYAKRNEATREFAQLVISRASAAHLQSGRSAVLPDVPVVPAEEVAKAFVGEVIKEHALSADEAKGLSALSSQSLPVEAPKAIRLPVEHEQFPRAQWALEVQDGSTRLGYEDWVEAKMDLAAEEDVEVLQEAVEPPEQHQTIPSNVLPVGFASPEEVQTETAVNQSPAVPDWRSRFSWSNTQRQRERGQLPGQGNGR